jgi:hypothetical protein
MIASFFCDTDLPNYLLQPDAYKYLHGRHSATGYYYWLLKNHGVDVHLNHPAPDIVVFHYDNKDCISKMQCKKIQVVTDRPMVDGCDIYVAANQSFFKRVTDIKTVRRYGLTNTLNMWLTDPSKWRFVHYPPTFGIKECAPQFPPKRFNFIGRRHTLVEDLYANKFIETCKSHDVHLCFDFVNDVNTGDEEVYFCVRNPTDVCKVTGLDNNSGKYGHRTANRLYQSWAMRVPGIFNSSPEMAAIKTSEYDFLVADSAQEFLEQALRLKTDDKLFKNMIENGISKDKINPYMDVKIVVDQWNSIFTELK